jgi:hypothetical protein
MSIHRTPIRIRTLPATLFLLMLCSLLRSFCGETVRSIATLTLQQRMNLPDNTQVTLKSGRTTTLGALRAEHRARMESFERAAALGRALAAKLKASANHSSVMPPRSAVKGTAAGPAPAPGGSGGGLKADGAAVGKAGSPPGVKNSVATTRPSASSSGLLPRTLVPLPDLAGKSPDGILPRDYRDFCQAADSSACVYLPANTSFFRGQYTGIKNTPFVAASDPLITDPGVCAYDGGSLDAQYGCIFYYPMGEVTNFTPNAPISSNASCDPAAHYIVDPKGAIQVTFTATVYTNLEAFTTPQAPVTCAVQVWLWQ